MAEVIPHLPRVSCRERREEDLVERRKGSVGVEIRGRAKERKILGGSARELEGETPQNGTWAPAIRLEQIFVVPKADVHACLARRPVFEEDTRARPKPWPNLGAAIPTSRLVKVPPSSDASPMIVILNA
jgi:hypothetical protein